MNTSVILGVLVLITAVSLLIVGIAETRTYNPTGKLTYAFSTNNKSTNYGGIAGMRHCQQCLKSETAQAIQVGRTAVWPSPQMMLEDMHGTIPSHIEWTRYFDLDEPIKSGIVVLDNSVQTRKAPGYIENAEYVDKFTPGDNLQARTFAGKDMYKCNLNTKFATSIMNPILKRLFKPSKLVLDLASKIFNGLGDNWVAVHVRRGDVLTSGYGKLSADRFAAATSIDNIRKNVIEKHSGRQVVVFTNETDPEYLNQLRSMGAMTEYDFEPLNQFFESDGFKDNFLAYEVAAQVFPKSKFRIGTHAHHLGRCHRLLL